MRCIECQRSPFGSSTLDNMGGTIAKAIAEAVSHTDTQVMALSFSYPRGDITTGSPSRPKERSAVNRSRAYGSAAPHGPRIWSRRSRSLTGRAT